MPDTTRRPSLAVRTGALGAALALAALLAGCSGGAVGPDATTAAPPAETVAATADAAGECAEVQASIQTITEQADAIQSKIPDDIPGALADLQAIDAELASLSENVQDPELKEHVDGATASVTALTDLLTKVSNGELSTTDAVTQGLAEYNTLTGHVDAISTYCAGV